MDLNRVQLLGHVAADPERRSTAGGRVVTTFRLATNRRWLNAEGQRREDHEFHRLVAWGKLGETASQWLHKGSRLLAEGRLHNAIWTTEDGVKRSRPEVVVEQLILLDRRQPAPAAAETLSAEEGAGEEPVPEVIEEEVKLEALPVLA